MIEYFQDIKFEQPWFFLLLGLIPFFIWFYVRGRRRKYVEMKVSSLASVEKAKKPARVKWMLSLFMLRILSFILIVTAIARPQTGFSNKNVTTEGIDIILAMDISSSMYAIDFKPNRITAAKDAAKQFIDDRPNDRIGLVIFAGEAFTQCPITLDHDLLKNEVDQADNWQLEDGTALGDGLFMAVNRLMDTAQINTKVIILLTDGVRTAGEFAPIDAANAAAQLNMRVYTIGVGSETNRPIPVVDKNGRNIYDLDPRQSFDESTLKQIATTTGGQYFRATDNDKLLDIYKQIDQIEKQKVEVNITKRYDEKFYPFAMAGIALLILELLLSNTIFRTLT